MNRWNACVLGWAALVLFSGPARADEPTEATKEARDEIRVLRKEHEAGPKVFRLVLKDGKAVWIAGDDDLDAEEVEVVQEERDAARADAEVARKKADALLEKLRALLEGVEEMPWAELAESFVDQDVLKEIEVTIKTPDGKTHKLGGKDGTVRDLLERFRYEPQRWMSAGRRGPLPHDADLRGRVQRLEDQNRRLQHEVELLRRRLNELAVDGRMHDGPVARRRAELRPRPGADDRLARIEQMLRVLLERQAMEHGKQEHGKQEHGVRARKRADTGVDKRVEEKMKRKVEEMLRKKMKGSTVRPGPYMGDPERAEKLEEMLERSKARIEKLMRELDKKRAEAEKLQSEIK